MQSAIRFSPILTPLATRRSIAFPTPSTLRLPSSSPVEDGFARYTPKQYADFFANREPGKANGRVGKILSIEVIEDIAWAKASIAIPSRDSLYVDLFLLKKIGDAWQIVSKTATKVSGE